MTNQMIPLAQWGRIAASIEVSPKQAIEFAELPELFPAGTSVYITDIGSDPNQTLLQAARRVSDCGYRPVPHIAARRLTSRASLQDRVASITQEAGANDFLLIGGGLSKPAGPFASAMDVLETGILDAHGVTRLGVAGHPEGSPDFSQELATEALKLKQAFGERTGTEVRIVTQFGFNGPSFVEWAEALSTEGIDLPVHLGVAGPAKVATLIKFAAMCGVGNSLNFFRKRAGSITKLATSHSPEDVVGPIERHVATTPGSAVKQIHVFPFGGLKKTSEWLKERGSWSPSDERTKALG